MPAPAPDDRRATRRNQLRVPLEFADLGTKFTGLSVDVSRGGLLATSGALRPAGTLLRVRVVAPIADAVVAVGVVVRTFDQVDTDGPDKGSPGLAVALTSTSEAWDRFWEDAAAVDESF